MINFENVSEFDDDFFNLQKRFPNLKEDFNRLVKVLDTRGPKHTPGTFRISMGAGIREPIYKVKQFRCTALQPDSTRPCSVT